MSNFVGTNDGLLILPYLQIQNANAIGSPLTHGFPSITAFVGFMSALNRKFVEEDIGLNANGVGVICHSHVEQAVRTGHMTRFCLDRHPVTVEGDSAPIIEEGRIHLEISLVFDVNRVSGSTEEHLFLQGEEALRERIASRISEIVSCMRVAGGDIISENPTSLLLPIPEDREARADSFRQWRRRWIPGFALVSRRELLNRHWDKMKKDQPEISLLDAWLDLSRFNYRARCEDSGATNLAEGKVEWAHDRPKGSGWIVPISVGYTALSPICEAGSVRSSRDETTPFRFVEALHSIGEWISPHRLTDVEQLLWYPTTEPEKGLYRMINNYSPVEE